ncbi:hypothetical protein ACFPZL_10560 [Leucobacter soli]|nr:hypothetical protein [Leucobacter soli]
MARVEVYPDRVVIRLTASEKAIAMRRRDIVLDRDAIVSAVITEDPWVWLRGVRSPGAHLPGRLALGTWRALSGRDFVVARSGRPAVVIDLDVPEGAEEDRGWVGEFDPFARVIISTAHAGDLVAALRLDGKDTVFDTAD